MRIAYLGPEGTFSHIAAKNKFLGNHEFIPCKTIADVFEFVEKGKADKGIVPLENSTQGSVITTYKILYESDVKIWAESLIRVKHCLIASGSLPLSKIKTVISHTQALEQCSNYLRKNLPNAELIEASSTAKACKIAKKSKDAAAIGSELAARTYNMKILASDIQDIKDNYTRFVVIGKTDSKPTGRDKTSVIFKVPNRPGALHHSLKPFTQSNINLTKIQSVPMKFKAWNYYFYVDFDGHRTDEKVAKTMEKLKNIVGSIKILGSYPKESELVARAEKVAIIGGTGRMGKLFATLLKNIGLNVFIISRDQEKCKRIASELGVNAGRMKDVEDADFVLVSVPIEATAQACNEAAKKMKKGILMDMASTKIGVADKVKSKVDYISIHPMFGPYADIEGQNVIVIPVSSKRNSIERVEALLRKAGFRTHMSTIKEHDRMMGIVQVVHHFFYLAMIHTLAGFDTNLKPFLSNSMKKTWDTLQYLSNMLYMMTDIQAKNKFAKEMREKIINNANELSRMDADKLMKTIKKDFKKLEMMMS